MKRCTIMAAMLLLAACGDKGAQQTTSTDIPFDTKGAATGPRSGHSDITAIDAALNDDAKMPGEAEMPAPPPPPGAVHDKPERPTADADETPAASDPIKLPVDPSVS